MKKVTSLLLILSVFCLFNILKGQTTRPFEFGLNAGAAWQQSDIRIRKLGSGGGFTFGRMYLENTTNPIDIGWRLRYLDAGTYGQDVKKSTGIAYNPVLNGTATTTLNYYDSTGYVYQNYKTSIHELSIELVIGANRMREKTHVYPYIYGGAGLVKAVAKINQLNAQGNRYDYSKISSSGTTSSIANQLDSYYDGSFETTAEGSNHPKWKFMPSLGVGLGYEITRGFMIGLEHKVTWALNDIIDGQQWNNNNTLTGNNDIYHYSSVWMKFTFGRSTKTKRPPATVNNTPPPVNLIPTNNAKPTVVITNPAGNPYTSPHRNITISAQVNNVSSKSQIGLIANGRTDANFAYDDFSHTVTYVTTLQTGSNSFTISATTPSGYDSKTTSIIYKEQAATASPAPVITISSPSQNPYTTTQQALTLNATVLHITSRNQIQLSLNGVQTTNFTYTESSKLLGFSGNLAQGTNTIIITATNSAGSDSKTQTVIYQRPVTVSKPVVTITTPSSNPYNSNTSSTTVNASVLNVTSSNQISVQINGVSTSSFTFNAVAKEVTLNVSLKSGNNAISISATNQAGSDSKATTIIYKLPAANTSTNPIKDNKVITGQSTTVPTNTGSTLTKDSKVTTGQSTAFPTGSGTGTGTGTTVGTGTGTSTSAIKDHKVITGNTVAETKQAGPIVTFTNPASATSTSSALVYGVIGTVLNVAGAGNITVKVNETTLSNFSYDVQTKKITFNANLVRGPNTLSISATNSIGNDSKTVTINFIGS